MYIFLSLRHPELDTGSLSKETLKRVQDDKLNIMWYKRGYKYNIKKDGFCHPVFLKIPFPVSFLFYKTFSLFLFPINYATTVDTKFTISLKESFTNSFASVVIGLFSTHSNT